LQAARFRLRLVNATAARFAGGAAALPNWLQREAAYAETLERLGLDALLTGQPAGATALALAAEALMNLTPWEYYQQPGGQLRPGAARAERLLLRALQAEPGHPLLLHLHVHVAEGGAPGPGSRGPLAAGGWSGRSGRRRPADLHTLFMGAPPGPHRALTRGWRRLALRLPLRLSLPLPLRLRGTGWPSLPRHPHPAPHTTNCTHKSTLPPTSAAIGRAEGSADALAAAAFPQGHLQHMASHLHLRVGRYADAVAANQRAYATDVLLSQRCVVPYAPEHNLAMLSYAAAMGAGLRSALAAASQARRLRQHVLDGYISPGQDWAARPLLLTQFGRWGEVLQGLAPPGEGDRGDSSWGGAEFAAFVWAYARFMAMGSLPSCPGCWAAQARELLVAAAVDQQLLPEDAAGAAAGRLYTPEEVDRQLHQVAAAQAAIPYEPDTRPGAAPGLYASAYRQLSGIMGLQAQAKRALMRGNATGAVALLRQAVAVEDGFGYIEPPRLYQPARQCLCFAERVAGDVAGAADACSADLLQYPSNVWSLAGLDRVCRVRLLGAGSAQGMGGAAALADGSAAGDGSCELVRALRGPGRDGTAAGDAGLEGACSCVGSRLATAAAAAEVPVLDSCLQLL
jgi:hypothetical protein